MLYASLVIYGPALSISAGKCMYIVCLYSVYTLHKQLYLDGMIDQTCSMCCLVNRWSVNSYSYFCVTYSYYIAHNTVHMATTSNELDDVC